MKILLTGGSGLLGTELQKHLEVHAPTHEELDITNIKSVLDYDLIIHAAAYTDVVKAQTDRKNCMKVNITGVCNLLEVYPTTPFVYISSEYARHPVNFYSFTKAIGEKMVEMLSSHHLIIRTLFKPNPFPWEKAFNDQWTQGDYVDIIAPLIIEEITKWNKKTSKVIYVGTGRKTMYDLAKRTKPNVLECSINDIDVKLPNDYV